MSHSSLEKKYQEALDYLYSFVDYSMTRSFRYSADKFNLERMVQLMDSLGNPQKDYKIVHIAGTKGKGSTAALCAQSFVAAGYKTGLYTSPHLVDYTERIQIDGVPISHEALISMIDEIKPYVRVIPELTTFEITTALAFWFFSKKKVQMVVAEVGLGGRLDATNIVNPLVSVITSISYDHTSILGNTLTKIAGEKAGIIKQGVPVIVAPQTAEARAVFIRVCKGKKAPIYLIGEDVHFKSLNHSLKGQEMLISLDQTFVDDIVKRTGKDVSANKDVILNIPLLGRHQLENAATAFTALQLCIAAGIDIKKGAIQLGFRTVNWPARFEIISNKPLVIIDSAHNRDSSCRLRRTLDEYLPDRQVHMIFGASEDKNILGMLEELSPRINHLYATQSTHPRAESAQRIKSVADGLGIPSTEYESVEGAILAAKKAIKPGDMIMATGSIFIAAAVRSAWK